MSPNEDKDIEKIIKRVHRRIINELGQSGGLGPRENNFETGISGGTKAFGAVIKNLTNLIVNAGAGIVDSISAIEHVAALPSEMTSIVDRPNEPLPENTPIKKIIDKI